MRCGRDAESNRNGARVCNRPPQITEPLRPATILLLEQARQGSNPDQRGWSSPCFRLHHGPVAERTTRIERASPGWRPGALPSELRPRSGTPGWSRTSGLCRRRTALSPLSYGRTKEPPAGVEPAPRPYKGRVLAVDTTEAKVETVGVEPRSPRCKRGARPVELHPLIGRTR